MPNRKDARRSRGIQVPPAQKALFREPIAKHKEYSWADWKCLLVKHRLNERLQLSLIEEALKRVARCNYAIAIWASAWSGARPEDCRDGKSTGGKIIGLF